MRFLPAWFLYSICSSFSCDLNHDWSLQTQEVRSEIRPYAFHRALQEAIEGQGARLMLISVRDLFSKTKQSEDIEEELLYFSSHSHSPTSPFTSPALIYLSDQEKKENLYEPSTLERLARIHGVEGFLRVKLTRYRVVQQNFLDQYKHNQDLKKKVIYHDLEFSWAHVGMDGRYKDFRDFKKRIEESQIFQDPRPGSRVQVAFNGWDSDSEKWKEETYFLGLDSLNRFGGILWDLSDF